MTGNQVFVHLSHSLHIPVNKKAAQTCHRKVPCCLLWSRIKTKNVHQKSNQHHNLVEARAFHVYFDMQYL